MIVSDGWEHFSTWEHSQTIRELYERRCRLEAEVMTSHLQAARILKKLGADQDTVLDIGCGSGYFFHALRQTSPGMKYYGIDASKNLLEIGRKFLPAYGLTPERLIQMRIEDLRAEVDHVVCINVLTYLDHYFRPLERFLLSARKTVILRESISETAEHTYVVDRYLDDSVPLKVPINTYSRSELNRFMDSYGFSVAFEVDEYTGGKEQMVIDHPHRWTFAIATRRSEKE